jgi:NADH:ubiquinone oxidoreductase subunit 2 (subunit N)
MFFSEGEGTPLKSSYALTAAVLICAAATVIVGVAPQPVVEMLRACVIKTP